MPEEKRLRFCCGIELLTSTDPCNAVVARNINLSLIQSKSSQRLGETRSSYGKKGEERNKKKHYVTAGHREMCLIWLG